MFIDHAGREAVISYGSLMLELLDDLVDLWKAAGSVANDFDVAAWVGEMVAIEARVASGELSRDVADEQRDALRAQLPLLGKSAFLVPVGAGGLSSGIFAAAKMLHPDATVIGVMTERTSSMYDSVKAARIRPARDTQEVYSEDGIKTGAVEQMALDVHVRLADAEVVVPHGRVPDGVRAHYHEAGLISEGASVLPYLALQLPAIGGLLHSRGAQDVVLLSTGSNVDYDRWQAMLDAQQPGWLLRAGEWLRRSPTSVGRVGGPRAMLPLLRSFAAWLWSLRGAAAWLVARGRLLNPRSTPRLPWFDRTMRSRALVGRAS